ncbi:UDP-glucuronosyltransferase [Cognataquiflexum rubidum]|uniref:UDP-glucuronosyltransferase n=1 Tax=Cognataquiflexum rubidum TaxID=2922273 RepID=UPI001F141377|nr:UDP-glucuronosyltransferase [Cognataquiflexum rubidum]MCH6236271.1 UDP-glucuronosyltransferase [Cognataquiflexum rubidum]
MVDFRFRPETYFEAELTSVLLIRLDFPESQWGEVISIYANLLDGMIHYEAVDFYGNDINLSPSKSFETLSTQEVIFMIETMETDWDSASGNMGLTLLGIPEVESKYYPDLKEYFSEKRKGFGLD